MKKLILITSIVATLATSSALAKTEGRSASVNILNTNAKFRFDRFINGSHIQSFTDTSHNGIGFDYKYAYNFDGVFVRPGVFFDRTNIEYRSSSTLIPAIKIDNRYGLKTDIGYDLEEKLSVYLVGGISFLDYSIANGSGKNSSRAKSDFFYGAGITYDYSKKVSFGLEYNFQNLNLKPVSSVTVPVDLRVLRIGMSYKF